MHFLNLLKGWIYIGLCALALIGLVYLVEQQTPPQEQEPVISPPAEQPVTTEETFEPTGEIKGPQVDESEPNGTPDEEAELETAEVIEPDPAASGLDPVSEENVVSVEEVVSAEETEQPSEILPETTEFEEISQDPVVTTPPEAEASPTETQPTATTEPETIEEPTVEETPVPELPVTLCLPLDVAKIKSQTINLQEQLVLELGEEVTVKAPATGKVAKIFDSPYTGKTLYLLDSGGSYVYLIGGFETLLGTVITDAEILCDSHLGTIAGESKLYLGVLQLEADQSWWQGKPLDPRSLLVNEK